MVPTVEQFMESLHQEVLQYLMPQLTAVGSQLGQQAHCDVCAYLSGTYDSAAKLAAFAEALRALDEKCAAAVGPQAADDDAICTIPAAPPSRSPLFRCRVRLWQLGFVEGASIKGPDSNNFRVAP